MSDNSSDSSQGKHGDIAKKLTRYFWFLAAFFHLIWLIILQPGVFLIHGPLHFRRIWQRLWNEYLAYSIEDRIISPATILFFTRSKSMNEHIWLKVWQRRRYENGNQNTENRQWERDIDNLLDGWDFNRRFAPGVYMGIAPIKELHEEAHLIQRGRLMFLPTKSSLKPGTEYVLVMRHLPENQRLDKQLIACSSSTLEERMEFLAKEVARVHKRLKKSPEDMGTYKSLSSKLSLNAGLFERALDQLASMDEDQNLDISEYRTIIQLLKKACSEYEPLFNERYSGGHIRRCHGDLKTTNLWVRPEKKLWRFKRSAQQLLLLDCVDFRPDFCHIDTLSDIAMLAVDIEARLSHESRNGDQALSLSQRFLNFYLDGVQENGELFWSLLEYYMSEKAIVCTYVSILFDNKPEMGKEYLKIALSHASRLKNLQDPVEKMPAPQKEEAGVVHSYSN